MRDFAAKDIAPHAESFDQQGRIPHELLAKMADLGLLGICVPPEYGGAGMDYLAYIIALEEGVDDRADGNLLLLASGLAIDTVFKEGN